jgi:hypothetical protein
MVRPSSRSKGVRRWALALLAALLLVLATDRPAAAQRMLGLEVGGPPALRQTWPLVELALEDGATAVLADITVPEATAAAVPATLGPLLGRAMVVAERERPPDRYARLPVLATDPEGRSLQAALLEAGLALVQPLPGAEPDVLDRLLEAERRAERAGRGLWRDRAAIVVGSDPALAAEAVGRFVLIEGRVLQASAQQRYLYLNFGLDWRTDTTARIDRETLRAMQRAGFDPATLEGRRVRLRGTLFAENGPMIELWTQKGIEILP